MMQLEAGFSGSFGALNENIARQGRCCQGANGPIGRGAALWELCRDCCRGSVVTLQLYTQRRQHRGREGGAVAALPWKWGRRVEKPESMRPAELTALKDVHILVLEPRHVVLYMTDVTKGTVWRWGDDPGSSEQALPSQRVLRDGTYPGWVREMPGENSACSWHKGRGCELDAVPSRSWEWLRMTTSKKMGLIPAV